jgi:hypothetical protein
MRREMSRFQITLSHREDLFECALHDDFLGAHTASGFERVRGFPHESCYRILGKAPLTLALDITGRR